MSSTPARTHPPNENGCPKPDPDLANADLPTAISLLDDLISSAESTLTSVSSLFSVSPDNKGDGPNPSFCRCPFDANHRMPPESLFSHSFRCPSAAPASTALLLDSGFLDTVRYRKTLKSEEQLREENRFVKPLVDSSTDLCFSLDGELGSGGGVGSNFFYKDCPGIVCFPEVDGASRTFSLPGILAAECANFVGHSREFTAGSGGILPSELWTLRFELAGWQEYPCSYSHTVLRVISCLKEMEGGRISKWIVSKSIKYGVLIDMALGDHILILLKLCLKAVFQEACCSLGALNNNEGIVDLKCMSFECPHLVQSLAWLASLFSILYGDANGKLFAIDILKEALLHAGSNSLLIPLDKNIRKEEKKLLNLNSASNDEVFESKVSGDSKPRELFGGIHREQVYVSQVAAAAAALHERSLVESRIMELRFPRSFSRAQLLTDHTYTSSKADTERRNRPTYRALLEHDGLLWQQSHNQGHGRPKTKEELLAEERDYKRRRMSYRGKKIKRSPTQVLHDIINDHMEAIRQAGGIGCNAKGTMDAGVQEHESNYGGIADCISGETEKIGVYKVTHYAEESNSFEMLPSRKDILIDHIKKDASNPVHDSRNISQQRRKDILIDHVKKDALNPVHDLRNIFQQRQYERFVISDDYGRSVKRDEPESESRGHSLSQTPGHTPGRYADQKQHRHRSSDYRSDSTYKHKNVRKDASSTFDHSKYLSKDKTHMSHCKISTKRNPKEGHRSDSEDHNSESAVTEKFGDRYDPSCSQQKSDNGYFR